MFPLSWVLCSKYKFPLRGCPFENYCQRLYTWFYPEMGGKSFWDWSSFVFSRKMMNGILFRIYHARILHFHQVLVRKLRRALLSKAEGSLLLGKVHWLEKTWTFIPTLPRLAWEPCPASLLSFDLQGPFQLWESVVLWKTREADWITQTAGGHRAVYGNVKDFPRIMNTE